MPNLNPAFTSVVSFADFCDAYTANPCESTRMTRNDLVRAWNLLGFVTGMRGDTMRVTYSEINVSQSSMRTIVSKLNTLFRHIGILASWNGLRISNATFYHADIHTGHLETADILSWNLSERAVTSGRRQDRVDSRHENGHRTRRTGRLAPLDAPSTYAPVSAPVSSSSDVMNALANIAAMVEGFNAFEGVDSSVFLTLEDEAAA